MDTNLQKTRFKLSRVQRNHPPVSPFSPLSNRFLQALPMPLDEGAWHGHFGCSLFSNAFHAYVNNLDNRPQQPHMHAERESILNYMVLEKIGKTPANSGEVSLEELMLFEKFGRENLKLDLRSQSRGTSLEVVVNTFRRFS